MSESEPTTETRVGHCKRDETDVYAGRGQGDRHLLNTEIGERGWLGNPYSVDSHGREECIGLFRSVFEERLQDDPEFRAAVRDLAGQTLGCWCQGVDEDEPACHAEIIASHADRLAAQANRPHTVHMSGPMRMVANVSDEEWAQIRDGRHPAAVVDDVVEFEPSGSPEEWDVQIDTEAQTDA